MIYGVREHSPPTQSAKASILLLQETDLGAPERILFPGLPDLPLDFLDHLLVDAKPLDMTEACSILGDDSRIEEVYACLDVGDAVGDERAEELTEVGAEDGLVAEKSLSEREQDQL
jgi:hypothetical protein